MNPVVAEKVKEAIRVMKDAVARTEKEVLRIVGHEKHTDGEVINAVMNGFTDGLFKSMREIECANRRNEEALLEKQKKDGVGS